MEISTPDPHSPSYSPETAQILHRLFNLKRRMHVRLPENLAVLKQHLNESNPGGMTGELNDYDLFYTIGIIFSYPPEPITMGELSRALQVPLSTATRIMDWLVKNGYAGRLPDPEDRRIVRVTLTETGQEMYRTINDYLLERLEKLMGQFSLQERESLLSLLTKLSDALEEAPR